MNDLHGAATDRDDLLHSLAETIAGDAALMLKDWKHLVLVSRIEGGTPDMTGFCYTGDGRTVSVSPSDFSIFNVLERLRDAMAEADAKSKPWLAALFRIDRETSEMTAEFEYNSAERWLVTPDNVTARAQEFAPAG